MNQNVTLPERHVVSHNSLPDSWIDRIFMQMSVLYGSKLSGLWSGSNLEDVKRGWADKLGGFREMPGAIKEALDALDSKPYPPTLPEFIALCREAARRHQGHAKAIDYKPTAEEQERANETIQKVAKNISTADSRDHLAWAKNPKSQIALDAIVSAAKYDVRRREILTGLVASGKCSDSFKLRAV